jgi:hypothetical protein
MLDLLVSCLAGWSGDRLDDQLICWLGWLVGRLDGLVG